MRRGQRTFRPDNKEDRHTCFDRNAKFSCVKTWGRRPVGRKDQDLFETGAGFAKFRLVELGQFFESALLTPLQIAKLVLVIFLHALRLGLQLVVFLVFQHQLLAVQQLCVYMAAQKRPSATTSWKFANCITTQRGDSLATPTTWRLCVCLFVCLFVLPARYLKKPMHLRSANSTQKTVSRRVLETHLFWVKRSNFKGQGHESKPLALL